MHKIGLELSRSLIPIVAAASVCLVAPTQAHADRDRDDHKCTAFVGPFSSVNGPPCTSPIGMCTHGILGGEFSARYDFTIHTLTPAGDPHDPTKFVYTGTSVVTVNDGSGVMFTDDTGELHIPADGGPAPFVTKAIVDRGTRRFKHTLGGFIATGMLEVTTGLATGSFSAVLCKDCKDKD